MTEKRIYVLGGIRWGFTRSGHTEPSGEHELAAALERVKRPREIVFPSLSYAYYADIRLMDGTPPTIPSVTFVNLSLPGADIPYEIEYVRQHLPCTIFVLYASDEDFRRCLRELPGDFAKRFQHYFMLRKPDPGSAGASEEEFDRDVRSILDRAVEATTSRTRNSPRFSSAFISYSHQDKEFARWLENNLSGYGIPCWLDEKQLRPGDRILSKVEEGIREREKVLLCASRHSLNSWWVDNEVNSVIAKEQSLWSKQGSQSLVLIPLNLDGHLFEEGWNRG
jgi:hypothetical protein